MEKYGYGQQVHSRFYWNKQIKTNHEWILLSYVCPVKVRAKKNAKSKGTEKCIAAPPQARAEARKSKLDNKLIRWCTSRPCKHGTPKINYLANHNTGIARIGRPGITIWKQTPEEPPMQTESGVTPYMKRIKLSSRRSCPYKNWIGNNTPYMTIMKLGASGKSCPCKLSQEFKCSSRPCKHATSL